MARIIRLTSNDSDKIWLVKNSLLSLRTCYPGFKKWFDKNVALNLDRDREVFLALQDGQFSGSLILKNDKSEKKICTLFVRDKDRYNSIGLDFIRIASEELETYKLPITISEDTIDVFSNARSFNFYQKEIKPNLYKKGMNEYIGYIMYHDKDKELRGIKWLKFVAK